MDEVLTVEATEITKDELAVAIAESGVEQSTALTLQTEFSPFFQQAHEWAKQAKAIVVTDVSETRKMQMARTMRLQLRDIRLEADKTRKRLKEDSNRYGKAVQGLYNVIDCLIVPIEKHLKEQEDFAEVQQAKLEARLRDERTEQLAPLAEFVPVLSIDLGKLSDENYQKLYNGAVHARTAKQEEEKRIEAERIAREKAEAEEKERARKELEAAKAKAAEEEKARKDAEAKAAKEKKEAEAKAKKEREAAEKKLAAEKAAREKELTAEREKARKDAEAAAAKAKAEVDAAAAKLETERKERERLEAELQAKRDAEAKAKREADQKAADEEKARRAAEKAALAAPDRSKLLAYADSLDAETLPVCKSAEANEIARNAEKLLRKISAYIREQAEKL